jgi:hypothetical protein
MIQGRSIDFFETRERRQAAESSLDTRQALVAPEGRQTPEGRDWEFISGPPVWRESSREYEGSSGVAA